jgi:UDP-N-acetylmuramoyl-L-alanyl-D-glutamate--2,6-diaminopimelate ligase
VKIEDLSRSDVRAIDSLCIKRLSSDSRHIRRGDTFVAYPGASADGRSYIANAIARGAQAVLWEKHGFRWQPSWRVPNHGVADLRTRAGLIASHVYHHPSARLWMVGVTGTNGKTTCSQWIARALSANRMRCGVIGTLGYGMDAARLAPLVNTTPDAVRLHGELAHIAQRGARAVSMEVSSIGLDQHRVEGVEFDVALFTNLTRDHLDYHRTMRRYQSAKARLFECRSLKYAIVNLDDAFGAQLVRRIKRRGLEVIGYGFGGAGSNCRVRVAGSGLSADGDGVRFDVASPWGRAHVQSRQLGRFNAYNLLATLAALMASGIGVRRAVASLAQLAPIPGRMQTVGGGRRPLVVVDYAHTPDALEKVLLALRDLLAPGARLICVFGCGGERDRGKRPLMGAVAARLADWTVLTSDNPRGEDPLAIIDDIVGGMECDGEVELDRARAIGSAIRRARAGDIVLIAGKGHETYQEMNGVRTPFNDMKAARASLGGRA